MWSADFCRRKESRRAPVTHSSKFARDFKESESSMGVHVFEEDFLWLALADDPRDVRPEVARIFFGELPAGTTERLAGVARAEDVDRSFVRAPVESLKVGPNRRRREGSVLKARNQPFGDSGFPFHVTEDVSLAASEFKAEADAGVSGAQFKNGWYSHIYPGGGNCLRYGTVGPGGPEPKE
jgi:hypothetical protein